MRCARPLELAADFRLYAMVPYQNSILCITMMSDMQKTCMMSGRVLQLFNRDCAVLLPYMCFPSLSALHASV